MQSAIRAVLNADDSGDGPPYGPPAGSAYQGELYRVGELLVVGDVAMTGIDAAEYLSFSDLGDGRHDVYLAYESGWTDPEDGRPERSVTAVVLVAADATAEVVAGANYEEAAEDVNFLDETVSAIYSSTPGNRSIHPALRLASGVDDYEAHAMAELMVQEAAGTEAPLLDVVVDAETGANALVFRSTAQNCSSIRVGTDQSDTAVCIIWSQFD